LDNISGSARKMGSLIDDLLRFSRTGRAEMQQGTVDMKQLLQEVLTPLKESTPDRNVEWVIGDLPVVRGDPALLRQVWANLLDNAAKYTSTNPSARIEVSCRQKGGEQVFAVADNGVGFDMRYANKLFGIFQRLHSEEQFPGTGIGLATVQRIIQRHGGRVWAEAELDRGATFYFSLPART
jgi:light-regulated signal transduction histidine kinase (bacteriophytochrome)